LYVLLDIIRFDITYDNKYDLYVFKYDKIYDNKHKELYPDIV